MVYNTLHEWYLEPFLYNYGYALLVGETNF